MSAGMGSFVFSGRRHLGFTLLEVMIAFAILASALSILIGTAANSSQQAAFAADLTRATLLAKSKMTDIEYELMDDGFRNTEETKSGDFSEEGFPDMRWEVKITPVEIPEDVKQDLLGQVNSQLFGNESDGALQGNAAFSSMLPLLIGQLPDMINRIGKKVRRIHLEVSFPFLYGDRKVKITQYVVEEKSGDFNLFSDVNKTNE